MQYLDLNKLPNISNSIGFLKYDVFQEFPELKDLGEVSERIYGCNHFSGGQPDEKYPYFSEKAHLRASLNEFISVSETITYPNLKIENTDFPLFHFLKELRVSNFHLKTFTPKKVAGKAVLLNSISGEISSEEFEVKHFIIENCHLDLFTSNRNYQKYYSTSEFQTTVAWVDEKQKVWGITHIVEAALRQYCEVIKNALPQQ